MNMLQENSTMLHAQTFFVLDSIEQSDFSIIDKKLTLLTGF